MTLSGLVAPILRYLTEFGTSGAHCVKVVEDVVVKSSRSLSHLLMSFLSVRLRKLTIKVTKL